MMNTKRLSMESEYSSKYPAIYSIVFIALGFVSLIYSDAVSFNKAVIDFFDQ